MWRQCILGTIDEWWQTQFSVHSVKSNLPKIYLVASFVKQTYCNFWLLFSLFFSNIFQFLVMLRQTVFISLKYEAYLDKFGLRRGENPPSFSLRSSFICMISEHYETKDGKGINTFSFHFRYFIAIRVHYKFYAKTKFLQVTQQYRLHH